MDDFHILQLVVSKDPEGLDLLVEKYGKLIYGKIMKTLQNESRDEADQVFNDVLMTLWTNIDCFDSSKGSLTNYIMAISKFKAIDFIRKNARKSEKETILNEEILNIADEEFSMEILEDQESFYNIINCLNEETQKLFILRYLMEKEIEEIALDLNMSTSNVYTKLSRGREKIKKNLIKCGVALVLLLCFTLSFLGLKYHNPQANRAVKFLLTKENPR